MKGKDLASETVFRSGRQALGPGDGRKETRPQIVCPGTRALWLVLLIDGGWRGRELRAEVVSRVRRGQVGR